jgi:hypothetical protein
MRIGNIVCRPSCCGDSGVTRTPATAPIAPETPQPSMSTRPVRTPLSAADSGALATARMCRPSVVRLNSRNISPTTASTTSQTPRPSKYSRAPPMAT